MLIASWQAFSRDSTYVSRAKIGSSSRPTRTRRWAQPRPRRDRPRRGSSHRCVRSAGRTRVRDAAAGACLGGLLTESRLPATVSWWYLEMLARCRDLLRALPPRAGRWAVVVVLAAAALAGCGGTTAAVTTASLAVGTTASAPLGSAAATSGAAPAKPKPSYPAYPVLH